MADYGFDTETINVTLETTEEKIDVTLGQFSAGTIDNYDYLKNRPRINGKVITGDMTSDDYGVITDYEALDNIPSIDGAELKGEMTGADIGIIKSYEGLTDIPKVDGVELKGEMTGADIGIIKNYEDLEGLPKIAGKTIKGELTPSDFGVIKSYSDLTDKPSVDGKEIDGELTKEELGIVTDYEKLDNLPKISGRVLKGNLKLNELGVVVSDTMANWSAQRNLISEKDVLYIYVDYQTIDNGNGSTTITPGIKIGDGHTKLNLLPFLNAPDQRILNHLVNTVIHITADERTKWNQAVSDLSVIQRRFDGGMRYIGTTTTEITDGSIVQAIKIGNTYHQPSAGDVVLYGTKEFMYSKGEYWVELGDNTIVDSLFNTQGKIKDSFLPIKSYDASTGTLVL